MYLSVPTLRHLNVKLVPVYMLWFKFILGLNLSSYLIVLGYSNCMIMSLKRWKIKFKTNDKTESQHIHERETIMQDVEISVTI